MNRFGLFIQQITFAPQYFKLNKKLKMKKVFGFLAIAAFLTACNDDAAKTAETKADSTASTVVAGADSTMKAVADTAAKVVDSTMKK